MNELIEHKSWWKRNWKWSAGFFSIIVLFLVLIIFSPVGKKISDISKVYADPNLLENALVKAQKNEEVVELLGSIEPIGGMDILRGIVKYSNNDTTIDIYVHITGSKEKGRMRVFADWNTNKWEYKNIAIASKKLKEPIVIVKNIE